MTDFHQHLPDLYRESLAHILLRCPVAIQFWNSYNINFPQDNQSDAHCLKVIKEKNLAMTNFFLKWDIFFPFAI